jgi:transposase
VVPTKFLVGTTLATNGITRVTRKGRPNYPIDFKRHLAALACEPGISVAKLALEHGINANLLFKWRRHYRAGWFGEPQPAHRAARRPRVCEGPKLLPVMTVSPSVGQPLAPKGVKPAAALEILIGGATVRVLGEVSRDTLRTVLDCLAERA